MTRLHAVSVIHLFKKKNFNFSCVSPTPPFTHLHLHLYEDASAQATHTVIWPTPTHTLWLARQPASFMKSFLSDAALCWTHASFWADITQSASQQLPDFLLTPLDGLDSSSANDTALVFFHTSEIIKQIFVSVETDVLLLRLSPANKKTRVMHENLFTYLRLFFQTLYIIDATTQRNERS